MSYSHYPLALRGSMLDLASRNVELAFSNSDIPAALSKYYGTATSFQELVTMVFGPNGPRLRNLIRSKLVAQMTTREYQQDLPNLFPSQVSTLARNRQVRIDPGVDAVTRERLVEVQLRAVERQAQSLGALCRRKEVLYVDHSVWLYGLLAKDLMPLDLFYVLLENHKPILMHRLNDRAFRGLGLGLERELLAEYTAPIRSQVVREFLRTLHPHKIVKILSDHTGHLVNLLSDTALQIRDNPTIEIPQHWSSLKQLHDEVSLLVRDLKAEQKNRPITYPPQVDCIDGMVGPDGLMLVLPRQTITLVRWGHEMQNCLAGYDSKVLPGESLVIGVLKDSKLTYALEIGVQHAYAPLKILNVLDPTTITPESAPKLKIMQFQARSNQQGKVEPADRKAVEAILLRVFPGLILTVPPEENIARANIAIEGGNNYIVQGGLQGEDLVNG